MYPGVVRAMAGDRVEGNFLMEAINRNLVFRFVVRTWEMELMKSAIAECYSEYERMSSLRSHAQSPKVANYSK
jgi:hypothetical protein